MSTNAIVQEVLPNGYWVSTVFLALNHQFGDGPPLFFETMVFPCDETGNVISWSKEDMNRYTTEDEALDGHVAMCAKWLEQPRWAGKES